MIKSLMKLIKRIDKAYKKYNKSNNRPAITQKSPLILKEVDLNKNRGNTGEQIITRELRKISDDYFIINNLILGDKNNSNEIDHIYINKYAIFVIETKNLSGRIYGDERSHQWTQVLNFGKEKYKIYNPLMQNSKHVQIIRNFIYCRGYKIPVVPITVFVQGNIDYIESENVYSVNQMINKIKRFSGEYIDYEIRRRIYCCLKNENNKMTLDEHISNVNKYKKE